MNPGEDLKKLMETLSTQRDELILKAGLAKLEARDEWRALESNLDKLRGKAAQVSATAGETAQDVAAAAKLLGQEIARGYERLRRLF